RLSVHTERRRGASGRRWHRRRHRAVDYHGTDTELNGAMTTTVPSRPATDFPITFEDIQAARTRISGYLAPTPLRAYPVLSEVVDHGIEVVVKHENHQPTNSFKIRNGLSFMTALTSAERKRGVVAASTGNHGQGIAFGGRMLDVSTTICVPAGN